MEYCKGLTAKLGYKAYFTKSEDKTAALQDWINGVGSAVIVATNALALGIDMENIRQVLHTWLSFDLLNYSQESGRAGRDGGKSEAIMLMAMGSNSSKFKTLDEKLLWDYMQQS